MYIKGVLRLSAISAALRAVGTLTDLYLLKKLGDIGVGRTSMLASVCAFFTVVATSGVALGMTRLTAEALATNRKKELPSIRASGLAYAAIFGTAACTVLFAAAPFLATFFGDAPSPHITEAERSLEIWALGMLLCAVSSALSGYLIGCGHAVMSAMCGALGQIMRAFLLLLHLSQKAFWPYGGMIRIAVCGVCGELTAVIALLYAHRRLSAPREAHNASRSEIRARAGEIFPSGK